MQIILTVINQMPLSFRSSRSTESVETLPYIPGTALLGGLAAAHRRLNRDTPEFADFFTSGKIRFGNLYPANFKKLTDNTLPVSPLPATAYSCKRFEGFLFVDDPDDEEERHGIADYLIRWVLFKLDPEKGIGVLRDTEKCTYQTEWGPCKRQIEPVNGFYRRGTTSEAIARSTLTKRLITRTGISRQRGVVEEQILYSREVLIEYQIFWGRLHCEDETLWKTFDAFLEEASHHELIYLGSNKSRGLGKITVSSKQFQPGETTETTNTIKDRVEAFTRQMKDIAIPLNISIHHALYIPVTLRSDVILRDELLRYQTTIPSEYFKTQWDLNGLENIYQVVKTRRVMGWNAFLRLPKTDDIAIKMGSVFLFGYNGAIDDKLWQTLFDIQTAGIGERRCEGFGEITIADPFHLEDQPL